MPNVRLFFIIIFIFLLLSFPLLAQEKKSPLPSAIVEKNVEELFWGDVFKEIQYFDVIEMTIEGDAEKIGLRKNELADYAKFLFKNIFSGIKRGTREGTPDAEERKKIGYIKLSVFVVGTEYPIAYYVEGTMGNMNQFNYNGTVDNGALGFGSKKDMPNTINSALREVIEGLAIIFFKARGEM